MLERTVTLPQLAAIAVTQAALGAGIGLLVAEHLPSDQRRKLGWALVAVGALSTVPLACQVICDKPYDLPRAIRETVQ
jgi:uncharacterized membrane protein YfcA